MNHDDNNNNDNNNHDTNNSDNLFKNHAQLIDEYIHNE